MKRMTKRSLVGTYSDRERGELIEQLARYEDLGYSPNELEWLLNRYISPFKAKMTREHAIEGKNYEKEER